MNTDFEECWRCSGLFIPKGNTFLICEECIKREDDIYLEKLAKLKKMWAGEETLGTEPITKSVVLEHPTFYSYCDGCEQWFENESVMVVEEVGTFCFKCLYNTVRLYFKK